MKNQNCLQFKQKDLHTRRCRWIFNIQELKTFCVQCSHKQKIFYVVCPLIVLHIFLCYLFTSLVEWDEILWIYFYSPKDIIVRLFFTKILRISHDGWKRSLNFSFFLYNNYVRNNLLINESSWWISDVENLTEENPKVMKYSLLYLCVSLGWKESNPYNKCLVKFGKSCFSLVLREKQT